MIDLSQPFRTMLLGGDVRRVLRQLPDASVQCCVTSPPYFGLRDYSHAGQIGLEQTPIAYVDALVDVFREVRRVLCADATLWLNLGDSYGASKQLLGIPWRVAFALQADGWYLRQDIIWHKPNPMPESVTDRCTKAHEYIFLLSKSERYFFAADANREPLAHANAQRTTRTYNTADRYGAGNGGNSGLDALAARMRAGEVTTRNRRSVWTVTTKPFKGAHFATYPPDLIEPCILAGSRPGGIVLDPFGGSGTTALVSRQHGRRAVYVELNPEYIEIARARLTEVP